MYADVYAKVEDSISSLLKLYEWGIGGVSSPSVTFFGFSYLEYILEFSKAYDWKWKYVKNVDEEGKNWYSFDIYTQVKGKCFPFKVCLIFSDCNKYRLSAMIEKYKANREEYKND